MNAVTKAELSPLRTGRITGSRVGAILGLNPHNKRGDVLREMVREQRGAAREFIGNEATRHGEEHEPIAIDAYENERGVKVHSAQQIVIHPVHDFLAVTPDGMIGNDGMIEVKAPFRGTYTHWREKPYYEAQMRLQMECAGRAWCDFAVLHKDGTLHISRITHDPAWLPSVMPELTAFMADYSEAISSDEKAAPFLATKERDDDEWRIEVSQYIGAKQAADRAQEALEASRLRLIELAPTGAKGAGVTLIRSERAGSVQYAKAIKALVPDADLSAYTSKPTIVYTVRTEA